MTKRLTTLFDFFFPRLCNACDKKLSLEEMYVCPKCFENLKIAPSTYLTSEFERHFAESKNVTELLSLYLFEKDQTFQTLMHQLKYKKKYRVGLFLGRIISEYYSEQISNWNADYIIPIPLHILKKADRGYNQAYYIAKGISQNTLIPVMGKFVKRVKTTSTQTKLNKNERKENMRNAFSIPKPLKLKGKTIVLVDDVITTGSTIDECAKILKEAGAEKIYALSAGIAYS